MASTPTIRVGVLLVDTVQVLDLSSVDIIGMLSKDYLTFLPDPIKAGAVPLSILYINSAGPPENQECTSRVAVRVDYSISDAECAPPSKDKEGEKTLDILLIPGPDPVAYRQSDKMSEFIKGHFESGTDVLSVCSGAYAIGYAGIVEGKEVMGPRDVVPDLKQKFPGGLWQDKRWVRDGNLWSSAGITNGHDMVAAYIRNRWPGPTTETVLAMADVGGRGQEFPHQST